MKQFEYTGKIPQLQGKTALVRKLDAEDTFLGFKEGTVLAQFDEFIIFNGKNLGTKWSPFPAEDFTEIRDNPVFGDDFHDDHSPFKSIQRRA